MLLTLSQVQEAKPVFDAALATGVIPFQPEHITYSADFEIPTACFVSPDGESNYFLVNYGVRDPGKVKSSVDDENIARNEPFTLGGLLTYDTVGKVVLATVNGRDDTYLVNTSVVSSPDAVNRAHAAIGLRPGRDILEIKRLPGKGIFTYYEWLSGVADKQIYAADFISPTFAEHDLAPYAHLQSWLALTPPMLERTAEQAGILQQEVDQRTHLPKSLGDLSVKLFIDALEDLEDITRPIYAKVQEVGELVDDAVPAQLNDIENFMFARQTDLVTIADYGIVGIISRFRSTHEERQDIRAITAAHITHLARVFLTLEDVQPRQDITPRFKSVIMYRWQRLIDQYGPIAGSLAPVA